MNMRKLLLAHPDLQLRNLLEKSVLIPAGYEVTWVSDLASAREAITNDLPDIVIIGEMLKDGSSFDLAEQLLGKHPDIPIILIISQPTPTLLQAAIRSGITDCLILPIRTLDVQAAIERAQNRQKGFAEWSNALARQYSHSLHLQTGALDTLRQADQPAPASEDTDSVLTNIVDLAVTFSGAERGCLMLLDENKGEFYMRTARNFSPEFVESFRLPLRASLAGKVLQSGKPIVVFEESSARKIRTSYFVHALIYAPISVSGVVTGVLGVDRQTPGKPFTDYELKFIELLAGFASLVIQNERQKIHNDIKRYKLETILTQVEDGLVVVSEDGRIILVNRSARLLLGVKDQYIEGKSAKDILRHPDLAEIIDDHKSTARRAEINLEDGRVLNAQITPIPEVGLAVVMQDITHLKELDRIKTDFVNTVSHDLRSPLTAILGYAELIDRAGPTTDQQKEFIRRIQFSVHNITSMINDLLDLGRIEAGFDARMEIIHLPEIVQNALEGLRKRYTEKNQTVMLDIPASLPDILGSPSRLRQMIENLVSNAIKFTPVGGVITISARAESDQMIVQFMDNGYGIPPKDQPHVFEKFYRGSNIAGDIPGTGLGLAIVKSIVESHQGRVWLSSKVGHGSTFTVVLPIAH